MIFYSFLDKNSTIKFQTKDVSFIGIYNQISQNTREVGCTSEVVLLHIINVCLGDVSYNWLR